MKKVSKDISLTAYSLLGSIGLLGKVYAQQSLPNPAPKPPQDILKIIMNVGSLLLGVAGALAGLMVIVSGIRFIVSSGSPEGTEAAKKSLTYSVVGLVLVLFSIFIVQVIMKTLA